MSIRTLIIDDSPVLRKLLTVGLGTDREIQVVGSAPDAYAARDLIQALRPDVLTLDVEMPRMTGVDFLRRLMPQYPIPTVMVSRITGANAPATLEALRAGAVDFVLKPDQPTPDAAEQLIRTLREKVKAAAHIDVRQHRRTHAEVRSLLQKAPSGFQGVTEGRVFAIGASTGGTEAVLRVLASLPTNCPGVVVTQHMPPVFTQHYADRLNNELPLSVKEAEDGDIVLPGRVLLAPGGRQMRVARRGRQYVIQIGETDKHSGHCPSVDVLFRSVAKAIGAHATGALLTGMGSDGAQGLLAMRQSGAYTIAQDEATSVVYGMPRVAAEIGAARDVAPLDRIGSIAMRELARPPRKETPRCSAGS